MSKPHLLILGGGSAALSAAFRAIAGGATVTMANAGLPVGGTCLNVGCVPSKYFIRAAEAMHRMRHPAHPGVSPTAPRIDFSTFVAAKQALIDELREVNYENTIPTVEGLRFIEGQAQLEAGPVMIVNGERVEGDAALIATGASNLIPPVPGLADTPYLTNEAVFDLPAPPASMIVLGGGYIALECAQMYQRMGTQVTVLQRSRLLKDQPADLVEVLEEALREEGMQIETGCALESVRYDNGFVVETSKGTFHAEQLFVGTGRQGNTDGLPTALLEAGWVATDELGRTRLPHVYAAGDITGQAQFVYTASHEAETAVDHFLTGCAAPIDYSALPWVMFTDPQIAGVGLSLEEALAAGYDADAAEQPVARWPRFRVACETRGFLRLIRDRKTNNLLGARIICPEAGDLVSELALMMRHNIPISEIAKVLHPYLTLSEGIEKAAGKFAPLDR